MEDTVGIDIPKDKPDAYRLFKGEHKQVCNDKNGAKALALWANKAEVSRVIFESTGVHHRCIETGLAHHEISFSRANPRQARRFCEGAGPLAKTDRVDAAMLAKTGAMLQLKADAATRETLYDLKQLAPARQALIKDRTAAKARPAATNHRLLNRQIKRRSSQIERDLSRIADLPELQTWSTRSLLQMKSCAPKLTSWRAFPASPKSQPVRLSRTCPSLEN
jgi:transposase